MCWFFFIVAILGALVCTLGVVSLFGESLGFATLATPEFWDKFQIFTISIGLVLACVGGAFIGLTCRK